MATSSKKFISNFTSSTTNRGVEARETELTNTRLDVTASSSTSVPTAAPATPHAHVAPPPTASSPPDSYLQVVVEKHHRKRSEPRRLPAASSPAPPAPRDAPAHTCHAHGDQVAPRCSCGAALGPSPAPNCASNSDKKGVKPVQPALACSEQCPLWRSGAAEEPLHQATKRKEKSLWTKLKPAPFEDSEYIEREPERVRVYVLAGVRETGGELRARVAGGARLERWARRWARPARAALREALAGARLLLAAPLLVLGELLGCAAGAALAGLGAVCGSATDGALKPALALLHNLALQPLLQALGAGLGAARAALRPLWGALGDALEPAARLLAAPRLLHVELRLCAHGAGAAPARVPTPTLPALL